MKLTILALCFLFLCLGPRYRHEHEPSCAKIIDRFEKTHTYDLEAFLATYPKAKQKHVAQCLEQMK